MIVMHSPWLTYREKKWVDPEGREWLPDDWHDRWSEAMVFVKGRESEYQLRLAASHDRVSEKSGIILGSTIIFTTTCTKLVSGIPEITRKMIIGYDRFNISPWLWVEVKFIDAY
jgi:hypothetical protein